MYSSDKDDDNMENNLPTNNTKRDEKLSEIDETGEICQKNGLVCNTQDVSNVCFSDDLCLENKRKLRIGNVRKQSDESVIDCTNEQDTLLAEDQLRQIQPKMSPVNLPNKRKESPKESANQTDQSTNEEEKITSEESHSKTHAIKVSILKYFSSAFNQFENDPPKRLLLESIVSIILNGIINIVENLKAEISKNQQNLTSGKHMSKSIVSESIGIYDFSKHDTKLIDEYAADNEQSEFEESEMTCPKCMKDRLRSTIISPGNRKDEQIDEEIKWKQNADNARIDVKNDENFTNSLNVLNVWDSELCSVRWKKCGKYLVSNEESTEGCVNEQIIDTNQTDQFATNYKRTDKSETDYEVHEIKTSNNEIAGEISEISDELLLLENSNDIGKDSSMSKVKSSFSSSVLEIMKSDEINSLNTVGNKSSSEDKLISQNKDMAADKGKFNHFCENSKFVFPKKEEGSSEKLLIKMLENDSPLHMNQSLIDTSKFETSNTTKSSKYISVQEMPRLEETESRHPWRNIAKFSPLKLFSDPQCDLIPIHNELESNIINLEHLENDPDFIESQKRILESISRKRQSHSSMKRGSDNDNKGKLPTLLKIKSPKKIGPKVPPEMALRVFALIQMLRGFLKTQGRNPEDLSQSEVSDELIKLATIYDPDSLPNITYVTCNYRDYLNQLPAALKITVEKSITDMLEANQRSLNSGVLEHQFQDTLPYIADLESTDSSSPENESHNTSETDSTGVRGNPGLFKDLTDVENDVIYQKKIYKLKNTVILPTSLNGDRTSTSEIESKIDSEDNHTQFIDDPRNVSRNSEDSRHEVSGKDPKFNLKDENMLEEKYGYQLSKISSASKYEISPLMKESQSNLQLDTSKRNNEIKLASVTETMPELEVSTTHFISTATQIPSSQAKLAILKNEDMTTENEFKLQNFPENPEFNQLIHAEVRMLKLPTKMVNKNVKISLDAPLSQNSVNIDNSEVSNISKSSEHISKEVLRKEEMSGFQRMRTSKVSQTFIESEYSLNSTYNDKESTIVNLEFMESDPRFIENQKQILESISRQHQPCSSMKSKSDDDKGKLPEPLN